MALSSPGIGSGLDVNGLIQKLMAVEQQPLKALDKKEATYQAKLSAYGTLKGALSSFQSSVRGLNNPSKYLSLKASSSDTAVATASAASNAVAGSYAVNVSKLAESQKLVAAGQASATAAIGTGTLTFDFGTISDGTLTEYNAAAGTGGTYSGATFTSNGSGSKTVTIDAAHSSLTGIRDAINTAKIGVTASIVNDGGSSPYRLVLSSDNPGKTNSLKISGGDDALSSLLAHDPAGSQKLQQSVAAQNTEATINGVSVSKPNRSLTDVVQGVTLTALKVGASTVAVASDSAGAVTAVTDFVKSYNELSNSLTDLTSYDPATKKGGPLQGDAAARSIQNQMRELLGHTLTGGGAYTSLSQVGISVQKGGTLALDSAKLQSALATNPNDVAAVFAATGGASDSLVSYVSATNNTKPGSYALSVTQLASQGSTLGSAAAVMRNVTGSAAAALTITEGSNDSLDVTVDGVSATITLTSSDALVAAGEEPYTETTLAAELQKQINAATGKNVTVTTSSGIMSITTNTSGATSQVSVTGGNGITDLLGAAPTQKAVITADLNEKLSLTVDGVGISITLAAGSYTAETLAAELQSKINGNTTLSAKGISVSATQTNGVMTLTSSHYGSTSKVSVTGGSSAEGIFGSAPYTSTTGVDVAGTFAGVAGTGSGQYLTGAINNADGLKVQITGGATGNRGTASYSQGYAYKLDKLIDSFLGSAGTIASKTDGTNQSIKNINSQREVLNRRLASIEARYRTQFTKLDTTMSGLTQTSNALTQQLAGLTKNNS